MRKCFYAEKVKEKQLRASKKINLKYFEFFERYLKNWVLENCFYINILKVI